VTQLARAIAAALVAAAAVAACGVAPAGGPTVRLDNGTTVPIAIHVNDRWVGTYPAGAVVDVPVPVQGGDYLIEARTPSSASLVSLLGTSSRVEGASDGRLPMSSWADVGCGRVVLSIGPADLTILPDPPEPSGPCP